MVRKLEPKLVVIFSHLVKGCSFQVHWRLADAVPMLKESFSFIVGDNRPISITPLLSNVFEKIVALKLSHCLHGKVSASVHVTSEVHKLVF